MKIVLCHNFYQQPGGEDAVFADEAALLAQHGHEVIRFTLHNDVIHDMSRWSVARRTFWNREIYDELLGLLRRERPSLVHFTNTFPLISPAAYYAASAADVPVVQSLHNYRLLCPNALFLRNGKVCEDCLGKRLAWPAIQHGCYRTSRMASAVMVGMLSSHRALGTWTKKVDRYIALTDFARAKFIEGGLPAERLVVKPNFVSPDSGPGPGRGGYAVCVGRLSVEKGIETLLAGWRTMKSPLPLKIVGDGPLADDVRAACQQLPAIEWLGQRNSAEVQAIIGDAACLIVPSVCYEGLPKTIVEAFCQGTPVVASRLGAMPDLVDHERTGLLFEPGDAASLAAAVTRLFSKPASFEAMRDEARREFELRYTARRNYEQLMGIYADVLRSRGQHGGAAVAP